MSERVNVIVTYTYVYVTLTYCAHTALTTQIVI